MSAAASLNHALFALQKRDTIHYSFIRLTIPLTEVRSRRRFTGPWNQLNSIPSMVKYSREVGTWSRRETGPGLRLGHGRPHPAFERGSDQATESEEP